MAAGLTRMALQNGMLAGLVTNPMTIALGIFVASATTVAAALQKVSDTANELTEDFAKVNGPIAATMAMNRVSNTMQDIELGAKYQTQLSEYQDSQTGLGQEWKELKAILVSQLLPIVQLLVDTLTIIIGTWNAAWNVMEPLITILGGILGPLTFVMQPIIWIINWIADRFRTDSTQYDAAIARFLNPDTYRGGKGKTPWDFPAPPKQPAGVF
jgi:hypothetical protein